MVNPDPLSWLSWALFLAGAPLLAGIVNKLKARLSGRLGPTIFQPYFELLRLARKETVYSASAGFITRLAPVLVLVCLYLNDLDVYPDADRQEAERIMAIQSLGSAVQNFLLTIYAAGYDAGWMCAPLFCPEIVREELGLDDDLHPHALIPVGLAAKDPVRKPRLPLNELIVAWR